MDIGNVDVHCFVYLLYAKRNEAGHFLHEKSFLGIPFEVELFIRRRYNLGKLEFVCECRRYEFCRYYLVRRQHCECVVEIYPEKYYLYKYTMFKDFVERTDYDDSPKSGDFE